MATTFAKRGVASVALLDTTVHGDKIDHRAWKQLNVYDITKTKAASGMYDRVERSLNAQGKENLLDQQQTGLSKESGSGLDADKTAVREERVGQKKVASGSDSSSSSFSDSSSDSDSSTSGLWYNSDDEFLKI